MRGPKPAYSIQLTAEEAKHLQHLIRAHTTPQTLAMRARIILTAHSHPEQSNQHIAAVVGTTDRTVRAWRGRWVKMHSLYLGQHGRALAQSRTLASLALPRLAAYP